MVVAMVQRSDIHTICSHHILKFRATILIILVPPGTSLKLGIYLARGTSWSVGDSLWAGVLVLCM